MNDRDNFFAWKAAFAVVAVLLLAGDAMAYTVPGPEFFGQFLSLIAWVTVAFSSVMLWPVYALFRRLRGATRQLTAAAATQPATSHGNG